MNFLFCKLYTSFDKQLIQSKLKATSENSYLYTREKKPRSRDQKQVEVKARIKEEKTSASLKTVHTVLIGGSGVKAAHCTTQQLLYWEARGGQVHTALDSLPLGVPFFPSPSPSTSSYFLLPSEFLSASRRASVAREIPKRLARK